MTKDIEKNIRKNEIKSRLNTMVDPKVLASFPSAKVTAQNTRKFRFGLAMLIVGVLTAAFGLYLPPTDPMSRTMFLCFALIYAGAGAWYIDRANRALAGKQDTDNP